jgi:hypothetical protein
MLGTILVGDIEDHHAGALPRAVGTIGDHVSTPWSPRPNSPRKG